MKDLKEYVREWQSSKDAYSLNHIVQSIMGFIITTATKYAKGNKDLTADLIQEGSLGVVEAVSRCNPDGYVSTYLCECARGRIKQYLKWNSDLLRMGKKGNHWSKILAHLSTVDFNDYTHKDAVGVSIKLEVPLENVVFILNMRQKSATLDDIPPINQLNSLENEQILQRVEELLLSIKPMKSDSFKAFFMEEETTQAVADKYGIQERWVRNLANQTKKLILENINV